MGALLLLCSILIIIGLSYLLFFTAAAKPPLEMVEGHARLQSAIQHLNNTGVDPREQSFKHNTDRNKDNSPAIFLGNLIG